MVTKHFFAVALFSVFSAFDCAKAAEAGTLESWVSANISQDTYPYSIVILESKFSDDDPPVFSTVSAAEINDVSYFQLQNTKSLAWDVKLNHKKFADLNAREILEKVASANYYLFVPKSGVVVFAKKDADGSISEMFSTKAQKDVSWGELFSWVQSNLGWDGVVLGKMGEKFIVGSTAKLLSTPNIQALAISGSQKSDVLSPSERSGLGLLGLERNINGFAVFEPIFVDQSKNIEIGTKLIIERKKK